MKKHTYFGVGIRKWIKNLTRYGVRRDQLSKYASISFSSIIIAPVAIYEKIRFYNKIKNSEPSKPPVFVIGHWRSGTTHLQNLMCCDSQWGYLDTIQSIFPSVFLSLEKQLSKLLPEQKRAMDNVKVSATTPSEEEIALAVMCEASFWQGYYFTDDMDYYFNKYVLFEGISQREISSWKKGYTYLLKKLTLRYAGKQLLLKNPPNTARVRCLLEMYPNAKFIYIYRNPLKVFLSRMSQYDSAVRMKDLQSLSKDNWESKTLRYYLLLLDKYEKDKNLIPQGNLVEVSFEELKQDPLETLSRVYSTLSLDGYDDALSAFQEYVSQGKEYEQNKYVRDPELNEKLANHWGKYFSLYGYTRVEELVPKVVSQQSSAELVG